MSLDPHDTIAAISSAPGGAARGIVRVSGPATFDIIAKCFASSGDLRVSQQVAGVSHGCVNIIAGDGEQRSLPCDLFYWPNQRSYTRQQVAEFHTLGGLPVMNALLGTLCRAGARLAEPGEFTLRAFLAGRLDLTQAEAVLGVIDAQERGEFDSALRQLAGGLAGPLRQLRDELLQMLAELEAGLDFVEDDIEFIAREDLLRRLQLASAEIAGVAAQLSARGATNGRGQVVLFGAPNVGKSTLFNALTAGATRALVSSCSGTTRDYLIATMDLGDLQCELVDTAGLEDNVQAPICLNVGALAQLQSNERHSHALVRVQCIDATSPQAGGWLAQGEISEASLQSTDLIVITKTDVAADRNKRRPSTAGNIPVVFTSGVTGEGLPQLRALLVTALRSIHAEESAICVAATADRCRDSLRLAAAAMIRARESAESSAGDELISMELRSAIMELGKVVGAVYTDDILDRIFSSFCIGK